MRKFLLACVAAAFTASGTAALAADENDAVDNFFASIGSFDASVALTSDYVFRGISQTDEGPAIQGSVGWSKDFKVSEQEIGLYASVWGSNVEFNDSDNANIELDYSGGITTTLAGVTLDAFAIYYDYPGSASSRNYDYIEAGGGAGYDFGIAAVDGKFYWSPDFFGGIGDAYYFTGSVSVPLPYKLTAAGHFGYSVFDSSSANDYADWSISLTRNILGFDLSVAYTDTNLSKSECGGDLCDARAVFTVAKSF